MNTMIIKKEHPFESFLKEFIPKVAFKSKQLNKALWILETTGSQDAADLKAEIDTELRLLFNDGKTYQNLLFWDQDPTIEDPLLKRQLNVLIRSFKPSLILKELLEKMAIKEAALGQTYASFRAELEGKKLSENEIRNILKKETDPEKRKKAWEASKEIGSLLAPKILELVSLRNQAAQSLGYPDYFQMQLELQEVDRDWLLKTFDELSEKSNDAYTKLIGQIEKRQQEKFGVSKEKLGPWAWSEPFCQEDPLDAAEIDGLLDGVDIVESSKKFYQNMGIDVGAILSKSDMFERSGKNQHAFCIHVDREGDVRTLNNVRASIKD